MVWCPFDRSGGEAIGGGVADAAGVVEGRAAGGRHPGEKNPPPCQKGPKEWGEAIGRGVADAAGVVEGGLLGEASWGEESTSMLEGPEGAGGFHLHGRAVGRGVYLHGGCSWGVTREGIRGTGIKMGGLDHFGNGSKGSHSATFK